MQLLYIKRFRHILKLRHLAKQRIHFLHNSSSSEIDVTFSSGRTINITVGKFARFANGSAVVKAGETAVMVTVVSTNKQMLSNFTPLTVDFRQRSAAAGRIPVNFFRRELGPSEKEILSARLVDRSIRPLFPSTYKCETQIVCNTLSHDSTNLPDVQAINGASVALALSDIPWNGPVGAVRLGFCDNEVIINPTRRELKESSLDLIVASTKQNHIVMLEGKGNVVLLQDLQHAIKKGAKEAQHIVNAIESLAKQQGKTKREVIEKATRLNEETEQAILSLSDMRLREVFSNYSHDKTSRDVVINDIKNDVCTRVLSTYPDTEMSLITAYFDSCSKTIFRHSIFEDNRRCDGRALNELRNINCQVDLYKPLHGTALFQRGQTQVFVTVALDSLESAMKIDPFDAIDSSVKSKNFFLHYDFPPYATGDVGKIGPINRREIGHGALAEKALQATFPSDYPFTVRITSEVLESNGSSSMATVCGASLALLDSGVPITDATAGVAIGLVTKNNDEKNKNQIDDYRILTDILGIEDYLGDMDFKISGTRKGITALQADIKLPGVPLKIIMEALQQASEARTKILDKMEACIRSPRQQKKDCWPVTETFKIEPYQRSKLIGIGGINIKKLYFETGVQLTPKDDTEFVFFAPSQAAATEAKAIISKYLESEKVPNLDFGAIYTATITELKETGVMVKLYPSMEPTFLHNSQLDQRKILHPSAIGLEVGKEIQVKYFGRDPVSGLMRLSRKVLQGPTQIVKNILENKQINSKT